MAATAAPTTAGAPDSATTTTSRRNYRLISADSHVTEPGDLWTSRVDAKYRDRVPRMERFEKGHGWIMEGVPRPIAFGFTVCAGNKPEDMRDWMFVEEMRAGGWDPAVRIQELDADSIDAEVLFPNRPWQSVVANQDADLHHAMVRAYNDWLSGYCAHEPERLGGVAAIPNRGIKEAIAEVERVVDMPGFVGLLLSCYPHGDTKLRPEDDELWRVIEQTGMPVAIHIMLNDQMPYQLDARKLPGTVHFYDAPKRQLELIFGGVLDRFPGLQFVLTEVDCGWTPYFAEIADDNYLRHSKATLRDRQLQRLPSRYMRDHFSYSFITDMFGIANRHRIGVHRMLWSNDYPHITSDWPYSWKTVAAQFADVPADETHAMLAGNALRLYRFPT
jgi:predicted TIM-barrel fold metal-dependent hydrolase